jgi:hypothetical protein
LLSPSKPDFAAPAGEQTRIMKTAAFRPKKLREHGVYPAFPVVGIGLRVARTGGRSLAFRIGGPWRQTGCQWRQAEPLTYRPAPAAFHTVFRCFSVFRGSQGLPWRRLLADHSGANAGGEGDAPGRRDRSGIRFEVVAPEDCGGGRMAASLPSRLRRTFANYPPRSNR